MGVVALSLGIVATGWGLHLAIDLGAGITAILSFRPASGFQIKYHGRVRHRSLRTVVGRDRG